MAAAIRDAIEGLASLGAFPSEKGAKIDEVKKYEKLLRSIDRPITNDEARVLIKIFGSDDYFGLASYLMHIVESAPNWPLNDCLENNDNEWVKRMRERASLGGE